MKKLTALAMLLVSGVSVTFAEGNRNENNRHNLAGHADHQVTSSQQDAKPANVRSVKNMPLADTLTVSNCWIRALPGPTPSAGYFLVKNAGSKEAQLTRLLIAEFALVSLHQTTHQDGKSRMNMAHDIVIPASGELAFKPGSYHAMLEKPSHKLVIGSQIQAEFIFNSSEKVLATCEVKPPNTISG